MTVVGRPLRRRNRPGAAALALAVVLHVVAVAVVLFARGAQANPLPEFKVYRVNIVSPPPTVEGPREPPVTEQPRVVTPPRETAPAEPKPKPRVPPPKEAPPAPPTETKPAQPSTGANADPRSAGGEDLNIQIEGERFPYPEYLENITIQIRRYFRWQGRPDLEAELYFVVERNGTVSDVRVTRPSGDVAFDFAAMSAVELAANRGAFGPLPAGFPSPRLPVSFFFEPSR